MRPDYLELVSPDTLQRQMQQQDIMIIDVHIPEQAHIVGTDLFIPFHKIGKYQDLLPQDKNTPIYLYCESGPMGNWAARTLHKLGYTRLYNLAGGSKAWRQAGYPVSADNSNRSR